MDDTTIDTYDRLAADYDAATREFWKRFPGSFIDAFAGKLLPQARVLDVGCGPGRDGLLLQSRGLAVTGLDASAAMCALSRSHGLEAVQGDMLALPFEDASFDGVWAYTSLIHLPKKEIPRAFSEIRRVLSPTGAFALGVIAGDGEYYKKEGGEWVRYFSYFRREEIERSLADGRFRVSHFEAYTPSRQTYLSFVAEPSGSPAR